MAKTAPSTIKCSLCISSVNTKKQSFFEYFRHYQIKFAVLTILHPIFQIQPGLGPLPAPKPGGLNPPGPLRPLLEHDRMQDPHIARRILSAGVSPWHAAHVAIFCVKQFTAFPVFEL